MFHAVALHKVDVFGASLCSIPYYGRGVCLDTTMLLNAWPQSKSLHCKENWMVKHLKLDLQPSAVHLHPLLHVIATPPGNWSTGNSYG